MSLSDQLSKTIMRMGIIPWCSMYNMANKGMWSNVLAKKVEIGWQQCGAESKNNEYQGNLWS